MLEIGTKLMKNYGSGLVGGVVEITKRRVVRDRRNNITEIIYTVGNGLAYGRHNEDGIRKHFLFVDEEATAALNEEATSNN